VIVRLAAEEVEAQELLRLAFDPARELEAQTPVVSDLAPPHARAQAARAERHVDVHGLADADLEVGRHGP
jgi:hypothetical protein